MKKCLCFCVAGVMLLLSWDLDGEKWTDKLYKEK